MMEERSSHAVMVMDTEDFSDYCSIASVTTGNIFIIFVHFFILLHYRFSAHISKAAILAILIIMYIYWFINQELIIIVTLVVDDVNSDIGSYLPPIQFQNLPSNLNYFDVN